MPDWLAIMIAVLGAISTAFGLVGVSAYINERVKHRASKKNQQEDSEEAKKLEEQKKLEAMKHEEYKAELKTIIAEALAPLNAELIEIKTDLGYVKKGVQVTCRNDLEELADKADKQNWLSRYDKDRFDSAYNAYHNLGKNGVMDATYRHVMELPESKPVTKKKKVLNESK